MRVLYALTILTILGCEDVKLVERDNPLCGTSCYTGASWERNRGACHPGTWRCEDNEPVECVGQQLPQDEFCESNVDLNCDGKLWVNVADEAIGQPCGGGLGACHQGSLNCVEGQLVCLGEGRPKQEDCSGLDRDCDGLVNNVEQKLCYSGNLSDLTPVASECRAGVTACVSGQIACVGEVLPEAEQCGAQRDANCNGLIDDVVGLEEHATDIVVMLDRSGSMDPYYPALLYALEAFALSHSSDLYRYSVIAVPDATNQPVLMFAGQKFDALVTYVRNLAGWTGGFEPSYTVFWHVERRSYPLELRPEARVLLLWFGDEARQGGTYLQPLSSTALDTLHYEIVNYLRLTGDRFIGFCSPTTVGDYQDFADVSGGATFSLELSGDEMLFALDNALITCD